MQCSARLQITASSSKKAWDTLQKEFQGSENIKTTIFHDLRRDFGNLSVDSKENINNHYTRVTNVVNLIKMNRDEIKEDDVVNKILSNSKVGVNENTIDLSR